MSKIYIILLTVFFFMQMFILNKLILLMGIMVEYMDIIR